MRKAGLQAPAREPRQPLAIANFFSKLIENVQLRQTTRRLSAHYRNIGAQWAQAHDFGTKHGEEAFAEQMHVMKIHHTSQFNSLAQTNRMRKRAEKYALHVSDAACGPLARIYGEAFVRGAMSSFWKRYNRAYDARVTAEEKNRRAAEKVRRAEEKKRDATERWQRAAEKRHRS